MISAGMAQFLAGAGIGMALFIGSLHVWYDEEHWVLNGVLAAVAIMLFLAALHMIFTMMSGGFS